MATTDAFEMICREAGSRSTALDWCAAERMYSGD